MGAPLWRAWQTVEEAMNRRSIRLVPLTAMAIALSFAGAARANADQATPTLTTNPSPNTLQLNADPAFLSDTATLTGGFNATGTITFTLTGPDGPNVVYTNTVSVNGDNSYLSGTATLPQTGQVAGAYHWSPAYSGDANNAPVTSNSEFVDVVSAHPTIDTSPTPQGPFKLLSSGVAPLKDSASFRDAYYPTGTLTFTLSKLSEVVHTETVPVSGGLGGGSYSTPTGYVLPTDGTAVAGLYEWSVTYSGDANNSGAASSIPEQTSADFANPTLETQTSGQVTIGDGRTITDHAFLSAGYFPTGSIRFELDDPTGAVVDSESTPVHGNGNYDAPFSVTPTMVGLYTWHAFYGGDANNNPASPEDEEIENDLVNLATPSLTTATNGPVVVGSSDSMQDHATIADGYNPTGQLTFMLIDPGGTQIKSLTISVNGNGIYNSFHYTPTEVGTYQWVVTYTGDTNNTLAVTSLGDEPEDVTKATPTITSSAGSSFVIGSGGTLTDSATLSGGNNPTGKLSFQLYDPTGHLDETEIITISGDGTFTTPQGFTPTMAGTWQWVVTYKGDDNNNQVATNMGDEPEVVQMASPTISTTAGPQVMLGSGNKLTDSATLLGSYNATGTITFTLTNAANATVDTETVTVNGDGTYNTPSGFLPTASGLYQWVASYTGDTNNHAVASKKGDEPETAIGTADLFVAIAGVPSPVAPPRYVTYTITIKNLGPNATQVTLSNVLPSTGGFVSATTSQGSCTTPPVGSTATMTCTLGSLASGHTATIKVVEAPKVKKGSMNDTATATVDAYTVDPNTANNTATSSVQVH
jgi:uncharacterized repeat protein (TIGR01451 family)